jgi:hypothetical protein
MSLSDKLKRRIIVALADTKTGKELIAAIESSTGGFWGSIGGSILDQSDLQSALGDKVSRSGDTMLGNINMNGNAVTNLTNPINPQDAVTKSWIEANIDRTQLIYVSDADGNNTTGNGSLLKPYKTIAAAIAAATAGTAILVLPGLYTEPTVNIPSTVQNLSLIGFGTGAVEISNGVTHTAGAGSTSLLIQSLNFNSLTLNESAAANGTIRIKDCLGSISRTDTVANVLLSVVETNIVGGTLAGGTNTFSECLFISSATVNSGLTVYENSKFVQPIEARGTATIRMLSCEPFGISNFINGTIVSGNTPTWEIDDATDYLGGYTGDIVKVILSNALRNNKTTRLITSATYTVVSNDYYIGVNRSGSVAITLHTPADGAELIIKDESGHCSLNPITLIGTVDNDAGGVTLSIDNGALHLIYRSGWRII